MLLDSAVRSSNMPIFRPKLLDTFAQGYTGDELKQVGKGTGGGGARRVGKGAGSCAGRREEGTCAGGEAKGGC